MLKVKLNLSKVVAIATCFAVTTMFSGCEDEKEDAKVPVLTTAEASAITATGAMSGGNVTSDGGAEVTERGVFWGTVSSDLIVSGSKTTDGKGTGSFTSTLAGLTANTTYYVCAYATNSAGTAYGNVVSFRTDAVLPVLTTAAVTAVTATTATAGGNIANSGTPPYTERGVCYATTANPAIDDNKVTAAGSGTGDFTAELTNLTAETQYYIRAYATNSAGTAYGNEASFTTGSIAPVISTDEITAITATTAKSGGNIGNAGTPAYNERGICFAITSAPTIANTKITVAGSGTGSFTADLTGLTPETKYYVRAYASIGGVTVYGNEVNFTTEPEKVPNIIVNKTPYEPGLSHICMAGSGTVTIDWGDGTVEVKTLPNKDTMDDDWTDIRYYFNHNYSNTSTRIIKISGDNITHFYLAGGPTWTGLDVKNNPALMHLNFWSTEISEIDLSANVELVYLRCNETYLTELNISTNKKLTYLSCGGLASSYGLTTLNLSANTALTWLSCPNNKLMSLDVSANTALTNLHCSGNELTNLDVSNNKELVQIVCSHNKLEYEAIIDLFKSLPNGAIPDKPLDIIENPGFGELTPSDILIATNKGWSWGW